MHIAKPEKKALTPQMRELMTAFEAQYGQARAKRDRQEPDQRR
jgi:hypothetical protein